MTANPLDPTAAPPLDRGISPIAGAGRGRLGKALAFSGLLVGAAAFLGFGWAGERSGAAPRPVQPARQVVAFEPAPTLANPGPSAPTLVAAPSATQVPALAPEPAAPASSSQVASRDQVRRAPIMAYRRSNGLPSAGDPLALATAQQTIQPAIDNAGIRTARARRLGDRNFLLLAGTAIPCILQTAMDSTTPGLVTCMLPADVYSEAGTVVLLEKGTRVLGEYRGGLKQGQRRLHVLWTRAVTPSGVAVALASPAADPLGRAGFDGDIDRHFWDRFGGALLLSVVDGAASGLARHDRHGFDRGPPDAAAAAVDTGRDIAPTLRKAQGSEVSIVATQDFDFSGVYGLTARR